MMPGVGQGNITEAKAGRTVQKNLVSDVSGYQVLYRGWWQLLLVMLVLVLLPFSTALADDEAPLRKRLVLAGPPAAVSYPLFHMMESGVLADVAEQVEFRLWSNPDQLRALALKNVWDILVMN